MDSVQCYVGDIPTYWDRTVINVVVVVYTFRFLVKKRQVSLCFYLATVTEFRGSHGMEEGKGERYLASGRQYGHALLGVRHQEEECTTVQSAALRLHVVRLSVRPWRWWIRRTDHIDWKSWKLITWTIGPTPSLFVAQRASTYAQENLGKFWGEERLDGEKWRAGAQKRQCLWNA